jgi:endonuclease YncB( thermonuclease family)
MIAIWFFVRASDTPARAPAVGQVSADASHLAVLDGDTIRVGDQVVRLEGIAAPARGSVCRGPAQQSIDCGSAAADALASLLRGASIKCAIHGHDSHGRPLADCLSDGVRLGASLVRGGWARAQTTEYRAPEAEAKAAHVGIWNDGS